MFKMCSVIRSMIFALGVILFGTISSLLNCCSFSRVLDFDTENDVYSCINRFFQCFYQADFDLVDTSLCYITHISIVVCLLLTAHNIMFNTGLASSKA